MQNSDGGTIQDIQLEAASDEMLKAAGALGRGDGCYTENQLQRAERKHQAIHVDDSDSKWLTVGSSTECELWEVAWTEIKSTARACHCSHRQQTVLEWRRLGLTCDEIAQQMADEYVDVVASTVWKDLQAAKTAIETNPHFGLYDVLSEVFRMSIHQIRAILWE